MCSYKEKKSCVNQRWLYARLWVLMFLTGTFMLWELVIGSVTNSIALVADSFHTLFSFLMLVFYFVSIRNSAKTWERSTFGWARIKDVGTVISCVFLLSLCFHISLKSLKRMMAPEEIENTLYILTAGAISLLLNITRICLLKYSLLEGAEDDPSDQPDTAGVVVTNMKEVLCSLLVILSALAYWFSGWEHRHCFDPLLSLLMVGVLVVKVRPPLLSASMVLLNCVPQHLELEELKDALLRVDPCVASIEHLWVWTLCGSRRVGDCHVSINSQESKEGTEQLLLHNRVLLGVRELLRQRGVQETTVQIGHSKNAPVSLNVCNNLSECKT